MSGLYNLLNGYNIGCVLLLPMLGRKSDQYPRFRDCYLSEDKNYIDVYTRVGGGNRNCRFGEDELYIDPYFVTTFDDEFDCTYATYRFKVPDKWMSDFKFIVENQMENVSDEYVSVVKEFYPNLCESGMIDELFRRR